KSAQIREILISESAWEEMTCLFAPSLMNLTRENKVIISNYWVFLRTDIQKRSSFSDAKRNDRTIMVI
ncbi:hypothetical protein C5X49_002800, partial [Klebsiella pneumoniae subsp. pneumoniae]